MSRLEELIEQTAKELNFKDQEDAGFNMRNELVFKVAKLYAEECCIKTLEEASLNACIEPKGMMTRVDKESIANHENIILL